MTNAENQRAVIGDNQAESYAARVTDTLEREYAERFAEVDAILDEARDLPREVTTDETATAIGLVIKRIRELDKRLEGYREVEKAPHRLSAEAVDALFFRHRERLAKRNPRDRSQKPGAADVLQDRINAFLERKAIEEENRRRAEADKLRKEQIERDRIARETARKAEEDRLAAERARKPENVVAKTAIAEASEQAAQQASVEAELAASEAQEAHISTLAKPAELSRTRGDGVLLTQAREGYVQLIDRSLLNGHVLAAILPYFTDAELEKAARGFAKATSHAKQLPGFEIGFRRKGVTR
jgi:hypothetical protein